LLGKLKEKAEDRGKKGIDTDSEPYYRGIGA
jgi:hypothetical protein